MKYKLIFTKKIGGYEEFVVEGVTDEDIMGIIDLEARRIAERLEQPCYSDQEPSTFDLELFRCDIMSARG